jgi:stress-induced-phosphoprotein 1
MSSADEFKAIGNKHFSAGEFDQAIDAYTEAIKLKDTDHVFFSNRSACYASLKRYQEALNDANKCLEINPAFARGYGRKGAALYGLGQKDEAISAYQAGLSKDPSNAGFQEEVARIQREKMQPPPMADPFAGMFNSSMWMKLANSPSTRDLLAQPDFMAIMKELESNSSSLQKYINDPRVMTALQVLLGIDKAGAGMSDEDPAPEPAPAPARPAMERDTTPVASSSSSSSSAAVSNDEEEEEEIDVELEKEKAERAALKAKADAEKELGTAAYKKKDFETAIQHYKAAYEIVEDPVYLMNLTAVYYEQKKYETVVEECEKILKCRITYSQKSKLYLRMANAEKQLQRFDSAIQHYKQSILEENSVAARKGLKETEEAKKKAEEAAYLDDNLSEELKIKGNDAVKEGNYPAAIEFYTDAIRRNPANYKVYANRALCFQKLMRWDKCMDDCDSCLKYDPTFTKAYIRKAKVLHYLKNYSKAMDTYRLALETAPEDMKAEVMAGLQETQSAIYTSNSGEPDEQRIAEAMKDPEMVHMMQDPMMQQVLQAMQSDPAAAQKYMQDPDISKKLEKLIAAGIIRFG